MASDLQRDYPFHSTLSQEVAAKSRMPKAWVRIDVLGRTKTRPKGLFCVPEIRERKIRGK
jgi:hypothetical protein